MPLPEDFCPYVGLRPYEPADRDFFFGREREITSVLDHLLGARVTIFYGASGVGKSSVLMAGVLPALQKEPAVAAIVFRSWQKADAVAELKREIAAACARVDDREDTRSDTRAGALDTTLPLDELLARASAAIEGTVLLILDQFEEYFLYFPQADSALDAELARAMSRRDVDAGFLISLREDALSRLDRLKKRVPSLLTNTVRLEHLSNDAARLAICRPVERYVERGAAPGAPVKVDPALVEAVLEQTTPGRLSLGGEAAVAAVDADRNRVEAPYLQLVMERLWAEECRAKSGELRRKTLDDLHGADAIVREHLRRVVEALPAPDQALCSQIIDRLVTPSGAKIAVRLKDLAAYAGDMAAALPHLVKALERSRVLTRIQAPAGQPADHDQVQILHDVMAAGALAWRLQYIEAASVAKAKAEAAQLLRERDRRQRWLIGGVVGGMVLSASMAALYLNARDAWSQAEEAVAKAQTAAVKSDERLIAQRYETPPATVPASAARPASAAASSVPPAASGAAGGPWRPAAGGGSRPPRPPVPAPRSEPAGAAADPVALYYAGEDQRAVAERLRSTMLGLKIDTLPVAAARQGVAKTEVRYFDAGDAVTARQGAERLRRWNFGSVEARLVSGGGARRAGFEVQLARPDPATVQKLVRDMTGDDIAVRRAAVAGLVAAATAAPGAIASVLDLFQPANIESLSNEARFNALYVLGRTAPLAWDAALYTRGRTVLAFLEQRSRAGVAVGANTRVEMDRLAAVLDAVRDGLPAPRVPN